MSLLSNIVSSTLLKPGATGDRTIDGAGKIA